MSTNEDFPILLPDLCRKMQYVLRKHEEQFMIAHIDESKCAIDAVINRMTERAIFSGTEDQTEIIRESIMSLSPIDSEDLSSQDYVFIEFAIPARLEDIRRLLDTIISDHELNKSLEYDLAIFNIDTPEKFRGSYRILVGIEINAFEKFMDMLAKYYSETP